MNDRVDSHDTAAIICEHGVGLDEERCEACDAYEAEHDRVFEGDDYPDLAAPVTAAPGAIRHVAYCRVCTKQISAETAAANGGNCHAHAHSAVGVRWQSSDDYRR